MSSLTGWVPALSLSASASGDADPDEVWDRYLRPQRWPQWSPQIMRVECSRRRITRGATGRVVGVLGAWADFEVTAVDPARRTWAWHVTAGPDSLGPVALDLEHGVQPYGRGTRSWVRVSGPAPVVVGYLPLAWVALRTLVSP